MDEIKKVRLDNREIILIGTAHVSKKSAELVKKTIQEENPNIVAVELDPGRYEALMNEKRWDETEITKVIKSGKAYLFLMQLLLTNFQRKIGEELGVKPGSEMISALKIARENNIPTKLVDRDIKITLKRAFNLISFKEKFKLLLGFVSGIFEPEEIDEEMVEELKNTDLITEMMEELGKEVPSLKKVLIDERDDYIAHKIRSLEGNKILAVVGAGHVQGIKKRLKEEKSKEEIRELEQVPQNKSKLKYVWYGIPLIFTSIIAWSLYHHGLHLTLNLFQRWFWINGILSSLGAILALAHPLSIITAFLAAPFTSLHPALAAGWFAGLVELWIRKPKVKDFDGLLKINGVRDLWKNRITKILLVISFANLGSSIGTFVALPYLMSLL